MLQSIREQAEVAVKEKQAEMQVEFIEQQKVMQEAVESGKMLVRVWQDDQEGLVDETILGPGDFTQVKPGKVHQFEGLEDGVAFELYWAEFNHNDIVRRTVGQKTED